MPGFVRDPVPQAGTLTQLLAWLGRVFGQLDDWHTLADSQLETLVFLARAQGITINWLWEAGVDTSTEPAERHVKGNNNLMSLVTQYAISRTELFGRAIGGAALERMRTGDQLFVTNQNKGAQFLYVLSGPPVPQGDPATWFQLDVTPVSGTSANPTAEDQMDFKWLPPIP